MRPTPLRPAWLLLALLLGATTACSESKDTPADAAGEHAAAARSGVDPADLTPDPLPDPEVDPGTCKIVTYTPATARAPQRGELCRPARDQRDVVVMVLHGGSGIGGSFEGMRPWANRLNAEGYVTFLPDYHLFTPGAGGPVFPLPEQNVKAAVQYLRGTARALGVSRKRVVVQGMSAGARVGSVAYTTPDDEWFGGPELWPDISDEVNGFIGFYHTYDGSMQYSSQYYGGPDDSKDDAVRQRWDKADAIAHADQAVGPALFITGSRDWNLIELHQTLFAGALRDADIEATTVVVNGGSHGFDSGTATRLSRLGEQAATDVLRWLNDMFPQDPPRDAQTGDIDIATAPDRSGEPPITYDTRRRPSSSRGGSTTTTSRAPRPSTTTTATNTTTTTTSSTSSSVTSTSSSTTTSTSEVLPGD